MVCSAPSQGRWQTEKVNDHPYPGSCQGCIGRGKPSRYKCDYEARTDGSLQHSDTGGWEHLEGIMEEAVLDVSPLERGGAGQGDSTGRVV